MAVAVTGHRALPGILVWLLVAALLWAAATLWFRTVDWKRGSMPPDHHITDTRHHGGPKALRPGETYTPSVRLRLAPNVPMAEAMCSRLRAAGIEAFSKRGPGPAMGAGAGTNDFAPAEIWVPADRVGDASALLGTD